MRGRAGFLLRAVAAATVLVVPFTPSAAQSCRQWRLRATTGPTPRGEFGLAYDARRGMTVLVGGANNLTFTNVFRETWEWDGKTWRLASTIGPTRRCDNAMSYDGTREAVVSFGGYDGTFLGDTWTWNGAFWVPRSDTGPTARADSFMAFDANAGSMILFGGLTGAVRGDTWRWDGTDWTELSPAIAPPARWIHRMAYDAARGEIVVFGGAASPSTVLGDMWTWNGSDWAPRTPATLPGARYANAIAYDSDRQVVMLFGGQNGVNFAVGVLGDTWEWNGTNWSALPVSGPSARSFVKMVYDQRRRKIVLFGGHNGTAFVRDTWELGSDLDVATEPVSTGVQPGSVATLHVVASGTGPFGYQWRKNGTPLVDGGRVSGATTDTLLIDPAEASDTGRYSVEISNACGPVASRDATLAVPPAPGEASTGTVPAQQMRASYDRATGLVAVTYAPACDATDHVVHYGPLAAVGTFGYSGSACALGTSGSTSFDPGPGSFFFLVVGNHGTMEGSYGLASGGVERPEDTTPSICALPQYLSSACE